MSSSLPSSDSLSSSDSSSKLKRKSTTTNNRHASTTRIQIQVSSKKKGRPPKKAKSKRTPTNSHTTTVPRTISASSSLSRPTMNDWPLCSASSLPPLIPHTMNGLKEKRLEFSMNDECTSLKLVPSGRHLVAGFSDGTVRLFDLTGRFHKSAVDSYSTQESLFDMDSDDSEEEEEDFGVSPPSKNATSSIVLSKTHQQHGAVAAQIHARGVHTSLLMHVDCSQDGLYCFAGVSRGSVELVAVDLSRLEKYHDVGEKQDVNVLDLITVHRHADAKLKGFGACTRLRRDSNKLQYLLFTGKGIKNIHIWSFTPRQASQKKPTWQCLYDTQTNGNSINLLCFRHDPNGLLQGISKSDDQKLRVWDLSFEQHEGNPKSLFYKKKSIIKGLQHAPQTHRPKRPHFIDVASSESTLGVAGAFCVCGGGAVYNQMSVVSLDVENVSSPFNHTDLALPNSNISSRSGRRQQRGELKCISNVAGMVMDAGHVLLELSDGSVVQYSQDQLDSGGLPSLQILDPSLFMTQSERVTNSVAQDGSRQFCLTRVGSQGAVVAAVSLYNPNAGRGNIVLRRLNETTSPYRGFWGFHGVSVFDKKQESPPAADKKAIAECLYPTPDSEEEERSLHTSASVKLFEPQSLSIVTPKTIRKAAPPTQPSPPEAAAAHNVVASPDAVLYYDQIQDGTSTLGGQKEADGVTGATVSPEQKSPAVAQVVNKKDGALMKFLRPAASSSIMVFHKTPAKKNKVSVSRDEPMAKEKSQVPSSGASSIAAPVVKEKPVLSGLTKQKAPVDSVKKAPRLEKLGKPIKSKKQLKRKDAPSDNSDSSSCKKKAASRAMDGVPKPVKRSRATSPKRPSKARTQNTDANIRKVVAGALCDMRRGTTPPRNSRSPAKQPRGTNDGARPGFLSPKLRRKRPKPLVDTLPKTTVSQRFDLTALAASGDVPSESTQEQEARQRLAAKHRAEHEMLRRRVLASVDSTIQSLVSSSSISLEEARSGLEEDVTGYEEMLHDILGRQEMEASALAAEHSLNKPGQQAPVLQVSFPFPEVFSQARASFQSFISGGSK